MFTILAEKFCDNFHSSKKLPSVVSATRAAWCQHSCACAGYDWVQSGEIDALIAPDSYLLPYMARPPCNTQVVGPYFGIGSMALAVPLNSTLLTRINTVSAIHPSPDLQFFNSLDVCGAALLSVENIGGEGGGLRALCPFPTLIHCSNLSIK